MTELRPYELNRGIARAREIFRQWNDVTGLFKNGTGYMAEVLGVIDEAVQCGWQAARNEHAELEGERDYGLQDLP